MLYYVACTKLLCILASFPEKQEKAWYIFYVIKPQGGLDHDMWTQFQ